MTENTLRLLHQLLCNQVIRFGADRDEIDAVLAAKAELEAAIADIDRRGPAEHVVGDGLALGPGTIIPPKRRTT